MEEKQTDKMRELFADKELSTEQMEEVAGGNGAETANDSRFLNVLLRGRPGQPNRYGETRCEAMYECASIRREVQAAWATVGIRMSVSKKCPYHNEYYDMTTGKEMGQYTAYERAMKRVGKTLKKSDWYWE